VAPTQHSGLIPTPQPTRCMANEPGAYYDSTRCQTHPQGHDLGVQGLSKVTHAAGFEDGDQLGAGPHCQVLVGQQVCWLAYAHGLCCVDCQADACCQLAEVSGLGLVG
jgi:hypothetical protein